MNHDFLLEEYGPNVRSDFGKLMLGPKLGHGQYRTVYRVAFAPDVVIKVESNFRNFHNVLEWEVWQTVKDTKWARWFAPCVDISPCGIWLVMKRATILKPQEKMPLRLPSFFDDLKPENFGRIGRQIVAVDYSLNKLHQQAFKRARMSTRKPSQWSTNGVSE